MYFNKPSGGGGGGSEAYSPMKCFIFKTSVTAF